MSDKMREEFEEFYSKEFGYREDNPESMFEMFCDDGESYEYYRLGVRTSWITWQASRAALRVNACAGMEDPAAEIAELKRQRDELLDVLGAAMPLIKQARLDWCDQNAESYDEDVVTPYDAILYSPVILLLETKGPAS